MNLSAALTSGSVIGRVDLREFCAQVDWSFGVGDRWEGAGCGRWMGVRIRLGRPWSIRYTGGVGKLADVALRRESRRNGGGPCPRRATASRDGRNRRTSQPVRVWQRVVLRWRRNSVPGSEVAFPAGLPRALSRLYLAIFFFSPPAPIPRGKSVKSRLACKSGRWTNLNQSRFRVARGAVACAEFAPAFRRRVQTMASTVLQTPFLTQFGVASLCIDPPA